MLKIDLFNHIWPVPFYEKLKRALGPMVDITRRSEAVPMMTDLAERFRVMDRFEDYQQVLSLASPPLELIKDAKVSADLARIGNDGMKELCEKYPDRFPGFIASPRRQGAAVSAPGLFRAAGGTRVRRRAGRPGRAIQPEAAAAPSQSPPPGAWQPLARVRTSPAP